MSIASAVCLCSALVLCCIAAARGAKCSADIGEMHKQPRRSSCCLASSVYSTVYKGTYMCVQGQQHGSHEWPEYAACKQWLWPACQSRMAGTKPAVPSQLIAVPEVASTTGAQADVSTCSMLLLLLLNCILLSQVLICRFAPQHDSGREGSPPLVTAQMSLPELYVSTNCCLFAQSFTLLNQICFTAQFAGQPAGLVWKPWVSWCWRSLF